MWLMFDLLSKGILTLPNSGNRRHGSDISWHFYTFLKYSESHFLYISWHFMTFLYISIHAKSFFPIEGLYQRPRRPGRFPGVASPEHQPTSRHFQASAWPCWETGGWPSLGSHGDRWQPGRYHLLVKFRPLRFLSCWNSTMLIVRSNRIACTTLYIYNI